MYICKLCNKVEVENHTDDVVCNECFEVLTDVWEHSERFECDLEDSIRLCMTKFNPEQRIFAYEFWTD